MNLVLTDVLACPRCGPPFGLILLADSMRERRVLEGVLGCPNCYGRYPVRGGLADLRAVPEGAPAVSAGEGPGTPSGEAGAGPGGGTAAGSVSPAATATRLAALMGLESGGVLGRLVALLVGPVARVAPELSSALEELEVVAADPVTAGWSESPGVSRALVAGRLPFFDGLVRGVTLSDEAVDLFLEEGLRVLHPIGRLVLQGAPVLGAAGAALRARVERAGGQVLAVAGDTLVAGARPR